MNAQNIHPAETDWGNPIERAIWSFGWLQKEQSVKEQVAKVTDKSSIKSSQRSADKDWGCAGNQLDSSVESAPQVQASLSGTSGFSLPS